MNDKELLEKLSELKTVKLDSGWKSRAKDLLFSQISNSATSIDGREEKEEISGFKKIFSFSLQPVAAALGVFAVFALGIFGLQTSRSIKPGNCFYTARVLSDKAQLAMTFDEEKKEKLGVKLASVRAQEITEVLSNTDLSKEENKKKAEKLSDAFKTEINNVKSGLENLNRIKEEKVASVAPVSAGDGVEVETESAGGDDDSLVYAVDSEKENSGIQIYPGENNDNLTATSSQFLNSISEQNQDAADGIVSTDLADEAENSFVANDFAAAKQLLEKVNNLIDGAEENMSDSGTNSSEGDSLATTSASEIKTASSTASGTVEELQ
jgi:hypothetical protein